MANITRFDPFFDVTRWDPVRDLEDIFTMPRLRPFSFDLERKPEVKIDVSEDDKAYKVKAEIPGVNKDDIQVSIDGNLVSISAEIKEEKEVKGENVLRRERYYGKQYRSFTLPQSVDSGKADAKYHDGVLELTLPKKADGASRQLKVQ